MFEKKNIIEIIDLDLAKQSELILRKININIKSSGITFIVGPNGAGKTQLVRSLNGLEKIKGSVKFNNEELSKKTILNQSFVFQEPILLKRSVLENIIFFTKYRKIKNYIKKSKELLKLVKLEKFMDKPALTLSGGEKQRLALARALSTTPNFLFLDEPTAHLDALSTNIIEKILLKISKNGTKVLFISHDINQVKRLGEDIIFMHKGKVQEFNKVKSFFKRQKSIYAKSFVEGKIII